MRTAIVLVLTAAAASAQQQARPCQAEDVAVQRSKVLAESQAIAPQQLEAAQNALAQCQALQVQTATRVAELRAAEAALRAREDMRAQQSLKQSSGGLQTGLADRWWKNPAATQYLGLTADQQKKMDDVFQQSRSSLMNLNYALEREESRLVPLVAAEPPDEAAITAQIDRVAQARAELEKANGRMLLGIRKQLTPDQWSKLNQMSSLAQPAGK